MQSIIDVHAHAYPRAFLEALLAEGIKTTGGLVIEPELSFEGGRFLDRMERSGFDGAVVSMGLPCFWGDAAFAAKWARRINEFLAEAVRDHPTKLGAYACLPFPDPDAALTELEYALDTLALDGVCLFSNVAGVYVGDPSLDSLFDELNRRKTVSLLHAGPNPLSSLRLDYPAGHLENSFDVTRAITNLLYSGTLARCPDIKIICALSGGAFPLLIDPIEQLDMILADFSYERRVRDTTAGTPREQLSRLHFDTIGGFRPENLEPLLALVSSNQILVGADTPNFPPELIVALVKAAKQYSGLTPDDFAMIFSENARRLFPRFRVAAE